jgi:hypothetical protein
MSEVAVKFSTLTIALTIGLTAVVGAAFRVNVSDNWEERRCDPYVVPIAAFFKPSTDPRSGTEFATENWSFCQKQYVQKALNLAAEVPRGLAAAGSASAGIIQDISSVVADVFFHLWKVLYETYATFMDKMKGVAKLFQNFMINLYSIVERLNASALSIFYGLIALIVTLVNSIQVSLIVAIIVIGIILILQILLFFILMPISGLIITVSALVSVVVVTVATAIAAAMVSEMFSPGACFAKGTPVLLASGQTRSIEDIRIGDPLRGGGRVTAVHTFRSRDAFYNLHGIRVTGDHLVQHPDYPKRLIRVSDHPHVVHEVAAWAHQDMWCLTTTSRRIPCAGRDGGLVFADWEEIPDADETALRQWYAEVWTVLNGSGVPVKSVPRRVLLAEAGLSPDCRIVCADWRGRRVNRQLREVRIGDRVYDSPTTSTRVVGRVQIEGDQSTDAVEVPCKEGVQFVSCATWMKADGAWKPATGVLCEIHPVTWEHLYTESGTFMIAGLSDEGHQVRDASDVGLDGLRSLVDSVVLG